MKIVLGESYRFAYPPEFTTLPEYTAHAGQTVTVIRRLTEDEADDVMFKIRAEDGWEGDAWPDELEATNV